MDVDSVDLEIRLSEPGQCVLARLARVGAVVAGFVGVTVMVIVLFPLGSDRLQHPEITMLSFDAAVSVGRHTLAQDAADVQIRPECRSQMLVHPQKTAKAVLMLHGYTSCPQDYADLAKLFYDRGYNVYVPREPHHGYRDVRESSKVRSEGLVDYADAGMDVVTGLGSEVGVIGLSGGGVLATWLAEYRFDTVAHLLVLAPFYRPSPSQAPGFLIKPAMVLFGTGFLPDRTIRGTDFTLSGLSQYLRIVRNFRKYPVNPRLCSAAVAFSRTDPFIDQELALQIPSGVARANGLQLQSRDFSSTLRLSHNIAAPQSLGRNAHKIDELYLAMYEQRASRG